MKTYSSAVVAAVLGLALGLAYWAPADGQEADKPRQRAAAKQAEEKADREQGMQCPMMAGLQGVELFADSPAVVRSQARQLRLTEEQVQRLAEIEESARREAREVLTAEQREELADAPEGRLSMMELCQMRMASDGEPQRRMMCPMCQRMMQRMKERTAGQTEEQDRR